VETDGDDAWARPTYRVYDAYAPHKGNEAIRTTIDAPTRERSDDDDLPLVRGSASTDGEGAFVSVTNLDCRDSHTVDVGIEGKSVESVDARVLFADQGPKTEVTADNAEAFEAEPLDADIDGTTITVDLPPATVATLDLS
jgi:alpha-N-arabinofuranosidase